MDRVCGPVTGNDGSSPSLLRSNNKKTTPRSKAGERPSGTTRPALPGVCLEDRCIKAVPNELDFPLLTKCCILSSWAKPDTPGWTGFQKEWESYLDWVQSHLTLVCPRNHWKAVQRRPREKRMQWSHSCPLPCFFPEAHLGPRDLGGTMQETVTGLGNRELVT